MSKKYNIYVVILIAATILTTYNVTIILTGPHLQGFEPLAQVHQIVRDFYVQETERQELVEGAIDGMLERLDAHSVYIPTEEVAEFEKQTSGSYEGIGIGIDTSEGAIKVISPFEDSPAFRAGIQPGDTILEVDQQSTQDWTGMRAVQELTGPAGTKVNLLVRHEDGREETIMVTRGEIHVPTVRGWRRDDNGHWDYLLDKERGIGYVRITQFTPDTPGEFQEAFLAMESEGIRAAILDLRLNPGGMMSAAGTVADYFLSDGVIVSTRGAHTQPETIHAQQGNELSSVPLVILIDQGSASAAEIVAGALQDHGRAFIVGQRSWGKGSVQRTFPVSKSKGVVKLTTDYYYLPSGRCVHRQPEAQAWGVEPDQQAKLDPNSIPMLRDYMQELTIKPLAQVNGVFDPCGPAVDMPVTATEQAEKLLELDRQLNEAVEAAERFLEESGKRETETVTRG